MLYEAKQGTKAYEYIKSILDAEFEEHQAYMKRVEEAVGLCPKCKEAIIIDGWVCPCCGYDSSYKYGD